MLTHEIVNSLTPIVSLSETMADNMAMGSERDISDSEMEVALSAISRRAKDLWSSCNVTACSRALHRLS